MASANGLVLDRLVLKGCVVTIDAMGTQANIAQKITDKEADYVLAVKDNQKHLAEAIGDFYNIFQENIKGTPHPFHETIEKNHGRLEIRRCYTFSDLQCLPKPGQWSNLRSFAVVES